MEPLRVFRREDLCRCAVDDHAGLVEHNHAVCARGVLHRVRDLHDRDAVAAQLGQQSTQAGAAARVEAGRRLVEDEQLGLHGEHARDGGEALLAAGELEGREVLLCGKTHQVERVVDPARDLVGGKAHVARAEGDV